MFFDKKYIYVNTNCLKNDQKGGDKICLLPRI